MQMSKRLETYLEEISRYLGTGQEKQEILTEIKSHILEKAGQEYAEVTEESIEHVVEAYGSPRQVAEKYLEDSQIIAPALKGHLLRYTTILFAFHLGLIALSSILKTSMAVLPFLYIPEIDSFQTLFTIPMAFFFDLGLVGFILYFVTQSRKDIRLPWPKLTLDWQKIRERKRSKPKLFLLFLMLLGYGVLIWLYWRSGTLFFKTIDFQNPRSLLTPDASTWYSLGLLGLLGIGIAAYTIKFFSLSEWVDLLRSACQLAILGIVINRPIPNPFLDFTYLDLQIVANAVIAVVAVFISVDFLKSLVILGTKALKEKSSTPYEGFKKER
jgi:hypothetical protein